MPELPEVEIVRRGLVPALEGKKILRVTVNRRDLRVPVPDKFESVVERGHMVSLKRRGKYILGFLRSGAGFVLHLGMSGRVCIYGAAGDYTPAKHDHVVFDVEDGAKVVFNDARRFGMLYLTSANDWQRETPFCDMGPEPLVENTGDHAFNGAVLAEKLKTRKSPIKTALLDQKIVAGIGNIYACEALYMAGIDPYRPACSIQGVWADRLAAAIQSVLEKALAAGGSSLKDYVSTDGTLGYFQTQFSVYDREGQACGYCDCDTANKGGVKRDVQAGRSTFYCPGKQK